MEKPNPPFIDYQTPKVGARPFRPGMQIVGLICLGISLLNALITYGASLESHALILKAPATYIAAVSFVAGVFLLVLATRPQRRPPS